MRFSSKLQPLSIPKCSIFDYLFPPGKTPSEEPQWIDARDTSHYVPPKTGLDLAKRLGFGLQQLAVCSGDVCLLFTSIIYMCQWVVLNFYF